MLKRLLISLGWVVGIAIYIVGSYYMYPEIVRLFSGRPVREVDNEVGFRIFIGMLMGALILGILYVLYIGLKAWILWLFTGSTANKRRR